MPSASDLASEAWRSQDKGPMILVACWTMTGISTLFVFARLCVREFVWKKLRSDDYYVTSALVRGSIQSPLRVARTHLGILLTIYHLPRCAFTFPLFSRPLPSPTGRENTLWFSRRSERKRRCCSPLPLSVSTYSFLQGVHSSCDIAPKLISRQPTTAVAGREITDWFYFFFFFQMGFVQARA